MFCPNCGKEIVENAKFCVHCGHNIESINSLNDTSSENTSTNTNSEPVAVEQNTKSSELNTTSSVTITFNRPKKVKTENSGSYYDGSVLERWGWAILGGLVTAITFGICAPIAQYWLTKFDTEHTVVDNKRMVFKMGLGEYFGFCILNYLLILVTLGIWGLYFPYSLKKKVLSYTYFEGEDTAVGTSGFDGNFWKFLGMNWIVYVISFATFGLGYPLAYAISLRWENKHSVVSNRRLYFNTNLWIFSGWFLLNLLLVAVTFGIYGIWFPVKINKLIVKDMKLMDSVPENERVKLCSEKLKFSQQILIGLSFVFLASFMANASIFFTSIGAFFMLGQLGIGGGIVSFLSNLVSTLAGLFLVAGLGLYLLTDKEKIHSFLPKGLLLAAGFKLGEILSVIVMTPLALILPNYLFGLTGIILMMIVILPVVKQEAPSLNMNIVTVIGALLVAVALGYCCVLPVSSFTNFNFGGFDFDFDFGFGSTYAVYNYFMMPLLLIAFVAYIVRFYINNQQAKLITGIILLVVTALIIVSNIIYLVVIAFGSTSVYSYFAGVFDYVQMIVKLILVLMAVIITIMGLFAGSKVSKLLNILYIIFSSLILLGYIFVTFILPKISFDFMAGNYFNKVKDAVEEYGYSYDDYDSYYGGNPWKYEEEDDNYGIFKGARMTAYENLRLRKSESKTSDTIAVMAAGTNVRIMEIGKFEKIDGISSFWIKVKVLDGAYDTYGRPIKEGTVGWCYGGYLK